MLEQRHGIVLAGLLGPLTACVPFGTAHAEFDSLARFEADVEPERVAYRDEPLREPFFVRAVDGLFPLDFMLRSALEVEPQPTEVDNPAGFARDRLEVLADRADGRLYRIAIAARRCLWVAELDDGQPMNQVVALQGIARLLATLGGDPLAVPRPDPALTEDKVATLLAAVTEGWPAARAGQPLAEDKREAYLAALQSLTAAPLRNGFERRAVVKMLAAADMAEQDPVLVEPTRAALLRSLRFGLGYGLLRAAASHGTVGDEPSVGRVREAAMRGLRQLAGVEATPAVLALVAAPPTGGGPVARYDPDRFVRLGLVRLCGELDRDRALRAHGSGPAAVEVLYEIAVGDPEPGLQVAALEALAHCLGLPVSFDPAWAEKWWRDEYVPNRGRRTGP